MSDKDTTVTGPNSAEDDGPWIDDLGRTRRCCAAETGAR